MSETAAKRAAAGDLVEVRSAGSEPAGLVQPRAIRKEPAGLIPYSRGGGCATSTLRNTPNLSSSRPVDLVQIYQCFCDRTRLRILNLLCKTPLCVCHFQELLHEPQVKISKHLGYLKSRGLVEANRDWGRSEDLSGERRDGFAPQLQPLYDHTIIQHQLARACPGYPARRARRAT
jgi:DNA-binding transcriptional ArsR family regulator